MATGDDDIIRDFLRRVRTVATSVSDRDWLHVELDMRQAWGGARPYVAKAPAEGKAARLAESLAAGRPLREAFDAVGVSQRSGYRLIGRRLGRR